MTPDEIQALREEHADGGYWDNPGCCCCEYTYVEMCKAGCSEWPCDVIKVLDALESITAIDENESCNHRGPDGSYYGYSEPEEEMDYEYAYCPKCGEKL